VSVDSAGIVGVASVAVSVTPAVTASFSFTTLPSCTLPENVSFTNASTNASGYVWDFGDGSATSTATNPVHAYSTNGNYTARLYSSNGCGTDSLVMTQAIQISGGAPSAPSQNICSGQTATLTASSSNINWYSDDQAVNLMQSGSSYSTPPLTNTITYYAASVVSPSVVSAGPASDAIGTSTVYNTGGLVGLKFNCTTAQTLNSVIVYASGAGDRLFVLEDASGNIIDSATITLINGQQTVPLGFAIPAGNNLVLGINGVPNLMRNTTGAAYPYTSSDATVSITGNTANSPSRYYFFYDWQLQQPACISPLAPVTVYVLGTGGNSFTASGNGSPTVNFTPADLTATSYAWDFGDGSTSTQITPTHTYAASGSYTVTLVVSNGSCSETITQTFKTETLGINDSHVFTAFTAFPNPAKDVITLNINSSKQFNNCSMMINDVLGQNTLTKTIDIAGGENKLNVDISALAPGIYFVSIQNGKEVVTAKFVKAND
jgi:PKD repeat protein